MKTVSSGATVRAAGIEDLDGILTLAEATRRLHATYEPVFWRAAHDARARQAQYLAGLLQAPDAVARVGLTDGVLAGFAIGRLVPAPPVYEPGGPTCLIDDFAVADPALWASVGVGLLHAVRVAAREMGAVQLVVVTAARDTAKRALLDSAGLARTSEWWTGPVDAPGRELGNLTGMPPRLGGQ
jgi:GNAT superfamily N-acetyltransferase